MTEHSDAYYDYKRNDPNAKNPFTDPVDRERAERVVNNTPALSSQNTPALSSQMRMELRQLINDVLDERELKKKLEGPYDFPEDEDDGLDYEDEWLYRATY